ncbi:MAG TPA: hypothetical protein PLQ97_13115 [Myxococcota bacterium]|nr:hypothetical protein [Myxococcota bacterium]HQK52130.1 hypothetical protein [Myxococcota bacterium]
MDRRWQPAWMAMAGLLACAGADEGVLRETRPEEMASRLSDDPGSYEWFNFYAESHDGHQSLSAIFFPANLFDCTYRKAVREWQANPDGAPRPRPSDYWLLQLNVTVDGTKVFTNLRRWPETTAEFPHDGPRGRIGDSTFQWFPSEGGGRFHVHLDAPDMTHDSRLLAEMDLEAAAPGFAMTGGGLYGAIPGGTDHDWQMPIGLPRTRVTYRVVRRDGSLAVPERTFEGGGYVDHLWGKGLLGDLLESWYFGTTALPDGGRVLHLWLTPAVLGAAPYGWVFRVRPGMPAEALPIREFTPSEPRTGALGLPFFGDLQFGLGPAGRLRVRFGDALGEDWPFQVSGPSRVDLELPGEPALQDLPGVAEHLVQEAIDDEAYCQAAAIIDLLPWNP